MSKFTERQAAAWPAAVAEIQQYVDTSIVAKDLHYWIVEWGDETRVGRGHYFNGIWSDGDYLAQVTMDVYGFPIVSVAEVTWLHNSGDEECDCEPCRKEEDK
jgi:hypothetical protein